MTKQKKTSSSPTGKSKSAKDAKPSVSMLPILVFVVGAGVLIWLIMGAFDSPEKPATEPGDVATTETVSDNMTTATNAVPETPAEPELLSDADRQKLLGKWNRTDNPPYTIEIRLVKPDGVTDARYFNPQPINVAEAFTVGKDGKLAFKMMMQDRGYEGSTYTLVYDEDQDLLVGEYFQATQRQTYEVAFQRADE